ncbi:MAG: Mpv17/PMP22 family protein [Syntrophothermus sp.]
MKRSDLLVIGGFILILLPFFLFRPVYDGYSWFNLNHGYITSFIKFAILATFGESIGLRIREGVYAKPGFGFLPRALVWGVIGMMIKAAFVIFAGSAPALLASVGITGADPQILRQPEFSWIKLLTAFTGSAMMNIYFAPMFMTAHKISDLHIMDTGGTLKGFFSPINIGRNFSRIDWMVMWNFVFKKTLIFFWIPAQTLNFMLPEAYRVLFAAVLSIILGILLSLANTFKKKKNDTAHRDVQVENLSVS